MQYITYMQRYLNIINIVILMTLKLSEVIQPPTIKSQTCGSNLKMIVRKCQKHEIF